MHTLNINYDYPEVTCTNIVVVRIYIQKFNNDKRRKEVAIGKVATHLCILWN